MSEIICEREEKKPLQKDLLGYLMNCRDERGQTELTKDQIADNIIGVLFAAQDTTASVLTWILKYLHDDPKLLEAVKVRIPSKFYKLQANDLIFLCERNTLHESWICLAKMDIRNDPNSSNNFITYYCMQAEQNAIYEENDGGKRPLTWAQTRNMPLTYRVRIICCFTPLGNNFK